jgi:hypothetical protein
MTDHRWDSVDEEEDALSAAPLSRRSERGKMPVAREARAKAASRATWRSRRATKRIARSTSGIRNRRNKKIP